MLCSPDSNHYADPNGPAIKGNFYTGEAGSGKSSASAKISLDWAKEANAKDQSQHSEHINQSHGAENTSKSQDREGTNQSQGIDVKNSQDVSQVEKLKNRFDFVFLVPLKHIDSDVPLEQLIIQEHDLYDKNITEDEIKTIIDSPRSLLIFDGYDEYKKGTNSAIDAAISGGMDGTFIVVTSRPEHMDKKDRKKVDGQIQNNGLSEKSVRECTQRYLEDEEKAEDFLWKAKWYEVYKLLKIPILLLMTSNIYIENETLPRNRSKIIKDIIDMYILRAYERGIHLEDTDQMLLLLGELSYEASQRDTQKLLLRKVSFSM